jgi:hypothetical protein
MDANGEPYADNELEKMRDCSRELERENNKLRKQLHRSMQLFGNLTMELKKNAMLREMVAKTEAAIKEEGL